MDGHRVRPTPRHLMRVKPSVQPPREAQLQPQHNDAKRLTELLDDFLLSSSIHGCSHLAAGRGNGWRKAFWLTVFVVGVAMAVYQSSSLISEYRRYVVLERSERRNEWELAFPSVTTCVNNPVRWPPPSPVGARLSQTVAARTAHLPPAFDTASADGYSERERILLEELSQLSATQRIQLGFATRHFTLFCTFGAQNCLDDLYLFNDLYYGNCVTFNPGFDASAINSTTAISLNMLFRTNFESSYDYLRRDSGLVLVVHAAGSAPLLDRRRLLQLYPGRWLKYGVRQTLTQRMPAPYSSRCIPQQQAHFHRPPYAYTADACLDSCLQNLSINLCNCIVPHIPFPPHHVHTVCPYEGCPLVNDTKHFTRCQCHHACQEVSYEAETDVDDRWLQQDVWMEWVNQTVTDNQEDGVRTKEVVGFEIYIASSQVLHIYEEPKVLWADFLGSLGGNIGLWVGLSILSILEVVELTFQLCTRITFIILYKLFKTR